MGKRRSMFSNNTPKMDLDLDKARRNSGIFVSAKASPRQIINTSCPVAFDENEEEVARQEELVNQNTPKKKPFFQINNQVRKKSISFDKEKMTSLTHGNTDQNKLAEKYHMNPEFDDADGGVAENIKVQQVKTIECEFNNSGKKHSTRSIRSHKNKPVSSNIRTDSSDDIMESEDELIINWAKEAEKMVKGIEKKAVKKEKKKQKKGDGSTRLLDIETEAEKSRRSIRQEQEKRLSSRKISNIDEDEEDF